MLKFAPSTNNNNNNNCGFYVNSSGNPFDIFADEPWTSTLEHFTGQQQQQH